MKQLTNRTKGMILKMIETIWGNLRTKEARQAWARAQKPKNKVNDLIFRQWLISQDVPGDVARRAWEQGSRESAIVWLKHDDRRKWIEYYNLQEEVNAAFMKHTPK